MQSTLLPQRKVLLLRSSCFLLFFFPFLRPRPLIFSSSGELAELRLDLQGDKRDKKKDAIKKVIASMTVGKDVSSLFPDVVNCMQTDNLELKKLVYLYLMNYAKSQPDLAILAVNTFSKVSTDGFVPPVPFSLGGRAWDWS